MTLSSDRVFRLRWWTLLTISLSVIIVILDSTILNVALPTLQRELNMTGSELQWVLNMYMMAFAALMLTTGSLGDRIGRARIMQAGVVLFALGSLAAAFATTSGQLIAWRAVMGIGGAMILPASLAIITNVFPNEERPKAIGVWAGINGIGVALGPIIGGLILNSLDWSWIFLVNLPVAALALLLGLRLLPDSRDPNPKRLDIPGTIFSSAALAALVYGLINGSVRGWGDGWVIGTLAGSVALGLIFVWWEKRAAEPMLEISFFKKPRFTVGVISVSIMALGLVGISYALTLYMQFVKAYTPLQTGVRFVPQALGMLIGAASAGRLVGRLGTRRVMVSGFLGAVVMVVLASFWRVDTPYLQIGLILFGMGFFLGYIAAPAADAIMGAIPRARAGIGSGMNSVTRMVAGAIGVAALGSVINSVYASSFDRASAGLALAPQIAAAARDSVGAGIMTAASLPGELGITVARIARQSFMDSFQAMAIVSAIIVGLGAVVALLAMPDKAADVEETAAPELAA